MSFLPDVQRLVWLHVDEAVFAAIISDSWMTTTRVLWNGRAGLWAPFTECG